MKVRVAWRLLSAGCLLLGLHGAARTQLVVDHQGDMAVRGFHGASPFGGGVRRSFQSDAEAKAGERFIFYNATFMQKLKQKTAEQWSLVSVLAHELGHHLAFHTELTGNDHKYELEADYFSGFVLRRLGASLDQSHTAMREISPQAATASHPASTSACR